MSRTNYKARAEILGSLSNTLILRLARQRQQLNHLINAADDVVGNWERGDLAAAVHALEGAAEEARRFLREEKPL